MDLKDKYFDDTARPTMVYTLAALNRGDFVNLEGYYFFPVMDFHCNRVLNNVKLRKFVDRSRSVESLPLSARFSADVAKAVETETKFFNVKDPDSGKQILTGLLGFKLNPQTRSYQRVICELIEVEEGIYRFPEINFRNWKGELRSIVGCCYTFDISSTPIAPVEREDGKQFINFIDFEKQFYAKSAFIVDNHYRLGGRSISKEFADMTR